MELLKSAYAAWSGASDLRQRRARYKRYTYGDQWSDIVYDDEGRAVREDVYLTMSGKRPMINNLIRQLVKSIVGRYRALANDEKRYADDLARRNCLAEVDSRLLEEFLISGCAVQRVVHEYRFGRRDVWVDNVDLRRFFVNRFRDPRGWDINLVGMLHDMSFPELIRRFGAGSKRRVQELRHIFSDIHSQGSFAAEVLGEPGADVDFFVPAHCGMCRVVEVWTLDGRLCEGSGGKVDVSTRWHCRWMALDGTILSEYDSPFRHGEHPFVVKFYPLTDGEVHSFVEDVIDQQRSINRLIVLIDKIMSASAKGVLLFPADQLPENVKWSDVTERWARADGVIPITGRGNYLPQQVSSAGSDAGAYQLLQLQMKLFDDISGVNDALLGRGTGNARGIEMLESQLTNATIALADLFDTFGSFTQARDSKAKLCA